MFESCGCTIEFDHRGSFTVCRFSFDCMQACRWLHREYDLAERLIGFEAYMGSLDLFEGKDGVDHWVDIAIGQQRHDLARERARSCDLLFKRAGAHHGADDVKAFAQDLIERDICRTAGDATDEYQPPAKRHCFAGLRPPRLNRIGSRA